jgi:hypothetical protein
MLSCVRETVAVTGNFEGSRWDPHRCTSRQTRHRRPTSDINTSKVDFAPSLAAFATTNTALPTLSAASLKELQTLLLEGTVSRSDITAARRLLAPSLDPTAYNWSFRTEKEPLLLGIDVSQLSDADKKRANAYAYAVSNIGFELYKRTEELDAPAKLARQVGNAVAIFGTGSAVSVAALAINPILGGAVLGVGGLFALLGLSQDKPFG